MNTPNNIQDPLANLREIHLPAEVSFWPPAPGWWVLAVVTTIAIFASLLLYNRHRRRSLYRREALAQLQRLSCDGESPSRQMAEINRLLKRVALTAYPNQALAQLHSEYWLDFLQRSAPATRLEESVALLLRDRLYSPNAVTLNDIEPLLHYSKHWIQNHLSESKLTSAEETSC